MLLFKKLLIFLILSIGPPCIKQGYDYEYEYDSLMK